MGNFQGRGAFKVKILEPRYDATCELEGGGGLKRKFSVGGGGGVDIFWNCTLPTKAQLT